jgi:hypothetical protein
MAAFGALRRRRQRAGASRVEGIAAAQLSWSDGSCAVNCISMPTARIDCYSSSRSVRASEAVGVRGFGAGLHLLRKLPWVRWRIVAISPIGREREAIKTRHGKIPPIARTVP